MLRFHKAVISFVVDLDPWTFLHIIYCLDNAILFVKVYNKSLLYGDIQVFIKMGKFCILKEMSPFEESSWHIDVLFYNIALTMMQWFQ